MLGAPVRQPWGKLVRAGGSERTEVLVENQQQPLPVPSEILLIDGENFVGRMSTVDPTKFSHFHQTVVPLAYMSSTHFCVGMRASVYTGQPPTYFLMDHSRNGTHLKRVGCEQSVNLCKQGEEMIYPGDSIILQFKAEVKLVYRFEIIETVPVHRTTMQTSIPMIPPAMASAASSSNSNMDMLNVDVNVPATVSSVPPPASGEHQGLGVVVPSSVAVAAAVAVPAAVASTAVAPASTNAATVQNAESTNNDSTKVASSSSIPPPPPQPIVTAAAAAEASSTSRKRQKSTDTLIDGDMVRMYQDERRQLESEITQLKLALEDAKKEKHKMDRDARTVQTDMAKVEKDHQQAMESVHRLEGELTAIETRYRTLDERVGELEVENTGLKDSLENAKKEVTFKSNQITSRDELIIRHNEDVSKWTQKLAALETQHDTLRQQYMTDVGTLLGKLREFSQTSRENTLLAIARLEATGTMAQALVGDLDTYEHKMSAIQGLMALGQSHNESSEGGESQLPVGASSSSSSAGGGGGKSKGRKGQGLGEQGVAAKAPRKAGNKTDGTAKGTKASRNASDITQTEDNDVSQGAGATGGDMGSGNVSKRQPKKSSSVAAATVGSKSKQKDREQDNDSDNLLDADEDDDDEEDDDDNDDDNHDNHNGFSPTQTASPDGAHGAPASAKIAEGKETEMDVEETSGEGLLSQLQSQTQALSQSQSAACAAPVKSKKTSKATLVDGMPRPRGRPRKIKPAIEESQSSTAAASQPGSLLGGLGLLDNGSSQASTTTNNKKRRKSSIASVSSTKPKKQGMSDEDNDDDDDDDENEEDDDQLDLVELGGKRERSRGTKATSKAATKAAKSATTGAAFLQQYVAQIRGTAVTEEEEPVNDGTFVVERSSPLVNFHTAPSGDLLSLKRARMLAAASHTEGGGGSATGVEQTNNGDTTTGDNVTTSKPGVTDSVMAPLSSSSSSSAMVVDDANNNDKDMDNADHTAKDGADSNGGSSGMDHHDDPSRVATNHDSVVNPVTEASSSSAAATEGSQQQSSNTRPPPPPPPRPPRIPPPRSSQSQPQSPQPQSQPSQSSPTKTNRAAVNLATTEEGEIPGDEGMEPGVERDDATFS